MKMNNNTPTPNAAKSMQEVKAKIANRNKAKMKQNNQKFKLKATQLSNK